MKTDLVVLDVMMPEMAGMRFAGESRPTAYGLSAVIMLTAKAQTAQPAGRVSVGARITSPSRFIHKNWWPAFNRSGARAQHASAKRAARDFDLRREGRRGRHHFGGQCALALAAEVNTILADFEPGRHRGAASRVGPEKGLGTLLEREAVDIDRGSVEAP